MDHSHLHNSVEYFADTCPPEPVPFVLTAREAIRYLRLDVGKSERAGHCSLNRLVEQGLRPALFRKERMFLRSECDRFLRQRTEIYAT